MVDHNETRAPGNALDGMPPLPLADRDVPEAAVESEEAAFARVMGAAANEEGLEQGGDWRPVEDEPVADAADAPQVGEGTEPGSEERAPAPTQDRPDDNAYRLAAAALRRDGWSTEDVALLPPERVIALGEKRRKVQDDTDTAFEELTKLRSGRGAARENEARRGENEAEAAPAQVDVSKIADRLALDEEGAQELAEFIRSTQTPLLEQLQQLRQEGAGAQRMAMQAAAETARRELAERFPKLKDATSDAYRRTLARMNRLQSQGNYGSVTELMEDSYLLEFRDDIRAEASTRSQKLRSARANGQMTTSGAQGKDRPQALSQEEHEQAVFDALMDESRPYAERKAAAETLHRSRFR